LRSNNTAGNNTGNAQEDLAKSVLAGISQGADLATSILAVHNQERALVGVLPLTWNNTLAAGAQAWADHMATTGQFGHAPVEVRTPPGGAAYGESITGLFNMTDSGIIEGVHDWTKEKNKLCANTGVCSPGYHGGPFYPYGWPNPPPELGGAPGHYTQGVADHDRGRLCSCSSRGAAFPGSNLPL
jgi:hypothetical protein